MKTKFLLAIICAGFFVSCFEDKADSKPFIVSHDTIGVNSGAIIYEDAHGDFNDGVLVDYRTMYRCLHSCPDFLSKDADKKIKRIDELLSNLETNTVLGTTKPR